MKNQGSKMVFVRADKNEKYTLVNNTIIKDDRLTMRARFLFVYFLSLPNDWIYYESEILSHFIEGRNAFRNAMIELVKFGYIQKTQCKENGKFAHSIITIYEEPIEKPLTENPSTENGFTENDLLQNTNKQNTKKQIINNIYKKGFFCEKHSYLSTFFESYQLSKNWEVEFVLYLFNEYYKEYERCFGVEHPRLKLSQFKKLLDTIDHIESPFDDDLVCDLDIDIYVGMIKNYFRYSSGMNNADGNINHFWAIRYTQYHEYLRNEDL